MELKLIWPGISSWCHSTINMILLEPRDILISTSVANTNVMVFGLIRQGLESTIYRTWGFDPTGARIYDLPHMRVWFDRGSNLRSTANEGLVRQGLIFDCG